MAVLITGLPTPESWADYTYADNFVTNNFVAGGAIAVNPAIATQMSQGSPIFHMPQIQPITSLGGPQFKIQNTTEGGLQNPTGNLEFNNLEASDDIGVKMFRSLGIKTNDLEVAIGGLMRPGETIDPVSAMQRMLRDAQNREINETALSIIRGVIADNLANDGADYIVDVSDNAGVPGNFATGVTDINETNIIRTQGTLGDNQSKLRVMVMHSFVYNKLRARNVIQYIPAHRSEAAEVGGQRDIETYMGFRVVVDDAVTSGAAVPRAGSGTTPDAGVYITYLVEPGFIEMGEMAMPAEKRLVVGRNEEAGNGAGEDKVQVRLTVGMRVRNHAFQVAGVAKGGPATGNAIGQTGHVDSWSRVGKDRKQSGIAALVSRES